MGKRLMTLIVNREKFVEHVKRIFAAPISDSPVKSAWFALLENMSYKL